MLSRVTYFRKAERDIQRDRKREKSTIKCGSPFSVVEELKTHCDCFRWGSIPEDAISGRGGRQLTVLDPPLLANEVVLDKPSLLVRLCSVCEEPALADIRSLYSAESRSLLAFESSFAGAEFAKLDESLFSFGARSSSLDLSILSAVDRPLIFRPAGEIGAFQGSWALPSVSLRPGLCMAPPLELLHLDASLCTLLSTTAFR